MLPLLFLVVIEPPFLERWDSARKDLDNGGGGALHLPANRFEPGLREKKLLSLGSPRVGVGLQGPLPRSSGGAESGAVATPLLSPVRCGAGAKRPDRSAAVRPRARYP